jgi:hypothetical protein
MTEDKEPRRWMRAFPRDWRDRYARELGALVDDLRNEGDLRPSDRIDIVRSGLAMRRHRVKRRSVYKALGPVFAAASVLVGLALAGTFGPAQTTPGSSAAGQIIVLPTGTLSPADGHVTFCQVTPSTGAVSSCASTVPSRVQPKASSGNATVTVRVQSGS